MTDSGSGAPTGDRPKKGMSTGAKIFFGCLGVSAFGVFALAAVVMVGGVALWRGADSVTDRFEDQQEATATLRRIEEEHPFEAPADGVVGEARMERFLAVTDDAWDAIRPWAEDLQTLRRSAGEERTSIGQLGDLAAGARAMGGLVQSRVAFAEVLEEHETSLAEYVWTGLTLSRAAEVRDGERSGEDVPPENVELARRYADRMPELGGGGNESGAVLGVATMWGLTELSTWQAMGFDTLMAR